MKSSLKLSFPFNTVLVIVLLISMFPASKVQADGIIIAVNTYADELNNNGLCSLREAIINANANAQARSDCSTGLGEDSIIFIPSLEGPKTVTLVSALPAISDTAGLTIDGEGRTTINGAGFYRAFYVNELASLTLINLAITNTYHAEEGGAIYNAGELFIFNSTFYNNVTSFEGGAIYQNSAIGGSFYIENSTFDNNFAGLMGGALTIAGGEGQIHSTSFLNNKTDLSHGDGGAIYVTGGTLKIHKSTFHHNQSRYGSAIHTSGNTILINSTIAENIAWNGGGIFASSGNLIISNTTISNNTNIGLYVIGNAHAFLYNTIIANGINGYDCNNGTPYSIIGNNNLIENDMPGGFACGLGNGSMTDNILDVDPNLGSLVFTPTYYYPLNSGSPAIDTGSGCEAIDQRRVTRPQGTNCDIGSYEKSSIPTSATFEDVPMNHPYWLDIEILYANGFTGGCSASPLLFCPDTTMDRAQGAVFMLRGLVGTSYVPPVVPFAHPFGDSWSSGPWAQRWAQGMLDEGLTAGCSTSPLLYCPWEQMPRAQAAVFGMRLLNGSAYLPPAGTGTVFADINGSEWYAGWAEQAYLNGLLPACGMQGSTPLFCPNSLVSRGLGAYMIVRSRNLSMP